MNKRLWVVFFALAAGVSGTGMALIQPWGGHGPGMMGWGHGWGWVGALLMGIVWVAVIVGIIALVRWLWAGGPRQGHGAEPSPLDILKARYARGEINKEEFEQKKKDLGS